MSADNDPIKSARLWVWISQLTSKTCIFCWTMHGTFHTADEKFSSHPNCRCAKVPATNGVFITEGGEKKFAKLSPAQQLEILGPQKFIFYRAGVQLKYLAGSFSDVSMRIQKLEENAERNEVFLRKLPFKFQQQMSSVLEFRKKNHLPDYYYLRPLPKELFPEAGTSASIRFGGIQQFGLNIRLQRNHYGKEDTKLHEGTLLHIQRKTGKLKGKTINHQAVRFLKHAEADTLIRLIDHKGKSIKGKDLVMTVDRTSCPLCLANLHLILEAYELRKLTIYDLHDNIVEVSPDLPKGHRYLKKAGKWLVK